jgi:16S rRNA G1207 methylase RsmC
LQYSVIIYSLKKIKISSDLQVIGCAVLHGEEGLDTTTAAVANDHDHLDFERADGILDGGSGAGVLALQFKRVEA